MNIIFGDAVKEIPDSFIILELDTFRTIENPKETTVYCVIEKIPTTEFATLDAYKKIHADLIHYYKKQEWIFCQKAIKSLMGRWNGEVDTFYADLLTRINQNIKHNVPNDWTAVIMKN